MVRGKTKRRGASGRRKTIRGGWTNTNGLERQIEIDVVKNLMSNVEQAGQGMPEIQMATVLFNYLATTRHILENRRFREVVLERMAFFRRKGERYGASRDLYDSIERLKSHIDQL